MSSLELTSRLCGVTTLAEIVKIKSNTSVSGT